VGNTGTIPYEMRRESADFPGGYCDKTKDSKDRCRWWYINSWALGVWVGETSSDVIKQLESLAWCQISEICRICNIEFSFLRIKVDDKDFSGKDVGVEKM
jgi:hypothetical protein